MAGAGSYDPHRYQPAGPDEAGTPDCFDLRFAATLQLPPTPSAVNVGEVLEVARVSPSSGVVIVGAINSSGVLSGSVIDSLDRLLPCMEAGVAFIAEVITVVNGIPRVRVLAASISRVEGPARFMATQNVNSPAKGTAGRLSLETSPGAILPCRLVVNVDENPVGELEQDRQAELQALIRVGVSFAAILTSPVAADVSHLQ